MTDKPAAKFRDKWWSVPAAMAVALVISGGVLVLMSLVKAASHDPAEAAPPPSTTTTTADPSAGYYNYLTCEGVKVLNRDGKPVGDDPSCNGLLIWPITPEARQLIGGEYGVPGALNMTVTRDIATQILTKFPTVDQCQLSIGIVDMPTDQATGISPKRRIVFSDLSHTRLVDCSGAS